MIVGISAAAEADIAEGDYFRTCIFADVESLMYFAGVHEKEFGFHRALGKRFPFGIYYTLDADNVTIVAILDLRRDPQWLRESLNLRQ